jgi:hypothetical protein
MEAGDLNYILSRLVGFFFKDTSRYPTIATVTGVLENVKQEFYRREAAMYEKHAIENNGDIPEYDRD